jgi:hypothetical protein
VLTLKDYDMKYTVGLFVFLLLGGVSLSVYSSDGKNSKILNKYREIIQESAPDDWYTLAYCAEQCLKKNIVNKEVDEWINKSLKIKRAAYNLEIKGDYYMKNRLPDKAGEFYLEAIRVGLEGESNFDSSGLQSKIARIINMET